MTVSNEHAGPDTVARLRPGGAVLVVGGGTMGAGIVQVLLQAGQRVYLSEPTTEYVEAAKARVVHGLERAKEPAAIELLETVVGIPSGLEVQLVIEAVPENASLKHDVLTAIEHAVGPETVIATNTSSMSVGGLAESLSSPERFVGTHFFNPVPRSLLVEIVVGPATSDAAVEVAKSLVELLGKQQIVVKDSPGFATSRLGLVIGLEAIRMLEEGVASAEDIDQGMVLGYKYPIGPLHLGDLVGLDVRLDIADYLFEQLAERFRAPQLLRDMVARGELGVKTKKGFFTYD